MAKMSRAIYLTSGETISISPPPSEVTNIKVESGNQQLKFTWTDPEDIIAEGINVNEWAGTIIVLNEEHLPVDQNDGRIAYTSEVKNQHKTEPCIINELINDKVYYYGVFPYSVNNTYNVNSIQTGEITLTSLPPVKPLSSYTWEEIELIANEGTKVENYWVAGENVYFQIGDTTSLVDIGDEGMHEFEIVDFLHDDLIDNNGKASISFLSKTCLYNENDFYYSFGSFHDGGGFQSLDIFNNLQEKTIKKLSSKLQNIIKTILKKGADGTPSEKIIVYEANLWVPTTIEMFGENIESATGEGEHYPCFTSNSSRIKTNNGNAVEYILSSPQYTAPNTQCYDLCKVTSNGGNENISLLAGENRFVDNNILWRTETPHVTNLSWRSGIETASNWAPEVTENDPVYIPIGFCVGNGGNEPDDGEFTVVIFHSAVSHYLRPETYIIVRTINQKIPFEPEPTDLAGGIFLSWKFSTGQEVNPGNLTKETITENCVVEMYSMGGEGEV